MAERATSAPPAPRDSRARRWAAPRRQRSCSASFLRARRSTVAAAAVVVLSVGAALLAPLGSRRTTRSTSRRSTCRRVQPAGLARPAATRAFPLGTDDQGRDILSTILYGSRISLLVGLVGGRCSRCCSASRSVSSPATRGGCVDALIMRIADVQLTFPAILIALLVDGVARGAPAERRASDEIALFVLVALDRPVRLGAVRAHRARLDLVERNKEYVQAARLIGCRPCAIMVRHILPNVIGPGAGDRDHQPRARHHHRGDALLPRRRPAADPALARHADPRSATKYLFSGEWWIAIFPGAGARRAGAPVNLLGDWLRDALNPRLR